MVFLWQTTIPVPDRTEDAGNPSALTPILFHIANSGPSVSCRDGLIKQRIHRYADLFEPQNVPRCHVTDSVSMLFGNIARLK